MTAPLKTSTYGFRSGRRSPDARDTSKFSDYWLNQSAEETYGLADKADDTGYYGKRSYGADADADRLFGDFETGYRGLIGEAEADQGGGTWTPAEYGGPGPDFDPGVYNAPTYGGQYGFQDEGDTSQYGRKEFYQGATNIDPNSSLGRSLAAWEASLTPTDYAQGYRDLSKASNAQLDLSLDRAIRNLESSAAGRGRLSSTLFDRDTGDVFRELAADQRAQLSEGALRALGYTQAERAAFAGERGRMAGTVLDALNFNADTALRQGQAAAGAGLDRADIAARNREAARRGYESDRDFGRGIYESDRAYGEDRYRDRRDFGRATYESDRDYGRKAYESDRDYDASRRDRSRDERASYYGGLYNAGQDRSDTSYGRLEDQRDRYYDWLAGVTDRAQGAGEASKERKSRFWGGVIGGAAKIGAALI